MPNEFNEPMTLFITWTTYGSWMPGDPRGWMKWKQGKQQPQKLLEVWCRDRMKEKPVVLDRRQRQAVEQAVCDHADHRGWQLHAVSVRSNHVHVALTVVPNSSNQDGRVADQIKRVRDELKANATRALRQLKSPISNKKVWTKGGDIQFVNSDEDLDQVVIYISEAQDGISRESRS